MYVGIEIGGSKLQIVAGDSAGTIQRRWRGTVDRESGGEGIRRQIERTLPALAGETAAAAIGVGFGGPVEWTTGTVHGSHQIPGWAHFPLAQWLGELTKLPVVVENDANVAALAEALSAPEPRPDPLFYVTMGSGVGGGMVAGGKIYHGAVPGEAEIGHIRLDRAGTTVECRCSGWAMDERVRLAAASNPHSPLAKLVHAGPGAEARHLIAAMGEGDPVAKRLLYELAADLALALSHVAHLFHPQAIILGGGLSLLGEPLRRAVEASLGPFVMAAFAPGPAVSLTRLGEDAVTIGALMLARNGNR